MTQHTHGQWNAEVWTSDNRGWSNPTQYVTIRSGRTIVAHYTTDTDEYPQADEENAANARLIAAAPDLLEALQRVLSTVEYMYHINPNPDGVLWQDVLVCRTVIAKATGQS
jgi:hypothetical protein